MLPTKDTFQVVTNGFVGMSGSLFAVISTFQQQLDWSVRFTGPLVGLTIGVVSLYRLVKRK